MKVIVCENYDEMSKKAANIFAAQLKQKTDSILGLATGSTPIGMYKELAAMNHRGEIDFSDVQTYNLDEYYPIKRTNEQSYYYFMNENLFSKVNIDLKNTHIPNGEASNPDEECEMYEEAIERSGGVDLQVLGIGQNGHIGFNEPDERLNTKTHLTALTESTIEANSRFFESRDEVPTAALTMGIATILKSKKIVLLASGANKHKAVAALLNNDINTEIPATMLKLHPDVVLICDKEAYSSTSLGIDVGGTDIKLGVIKDGEIIAKSKIPTLFKDNTDKLIDYIVDESKKLIDEYVITKVGVGVPGNILNKKVTASNLPFNNTPLAEILTKKLGIKVRVENDANCAALGEATLGEGENVKNEIMITIGTGVGGGIIIKNKIYHGRGDAGEIGHMIVDISEKQCPCGQRGCLEQYASAAALAEEAKTAAETNKTSVLYKLYSDNDSKMDGEIFFTALKSGCKTAESVFEKYTDYLAAGIKSLINIFSPDIVVLSGGITLQGDVILKPIAEKVNSSVPIKISALQSDAGIVGAAML